MMSEEMMSEEMMNAGKQLPTTEILDVTSEGVVIINRLGQILKANRAALEICGYSEDELTGETALVLFKRGERVDTLFRLYEVFKKGMINDAEFNFVNKAGEEISVRINAKVASDESDGEYIVAAFEDITGQKRLEKMRQKKITDTLKRLKETHEEKSRKLEDYSKIRKTQETALKSIKLQLASENRISTVVEEYKALLGPLREAHSAKLTKYPNRVR